MIRGEGKLQLSLLVEMQVHGPTKSGPAASGMELCDKSMQVTPAHMVLLANRDALGLGHDAGRTAELTLDLLASPAGSVDCPGLELAVGLGLLDESSQPVLAEDVNELPVGISIGEITDYKLVWGKAMANKATYPMTPMDARMRASLRFMSLAIWLRS